MTDLFAESVAAIEHQYEILGKFYYSDFLRSGGIKKLHEWLREIRRERFDPHQRILFIQDQDDQYDYQTELGLGTAALQEAMAMIDISNCFGIVLTHNHDIEQELSLANQIYSKSQDIIGSVIVPGSYHKNERTYSDTFCRLPWTHLYIGADGSVLPCCTGNTKFPMGNINENSLEEIFNNKNYRELRQRMLTGRRTRECVSCWYKEDSGLPSIRQRWKQDSDIKSLLKPDGSITKLAPKTMDIRISKLCNLKCRSCSPRLSSAIAQEIEEIYGQRWPMLDNRQRKQALPEILNLLPGVESIYFSGGEPLLSPEHSAMIDELVRLGKTDVGLWYNTNFMQLKYKDRDFVDIWNQFSDVFIGASLDAFGAEAEYLRHGTKWSVIEKNLLDFNSRRGPRVGLRVTSTLGLLNAESLMYLQKNWVERNLLSIDEFEIQEFIFDSHLSLQVLPRHHKHRLESLIEDHIIWVKQQNGTALADRWKQAIDYMWEADWTHLLPEFRRLTLETDRHRGESFHEIFPQFQDLIPLENQSESSTIKS